MAKAKKKEPEKQSSEELFMALDLLEKEKGIPAAYMLDKIKKAIATACKNSYGNEDVDLDVDRETGVFNVYLRKEIVEEVEDPNRQYLLDKAKLVDPTAAPGRFVRVKLDTKQFGRVAAQTARNIIRQGIRDSERGQMMQEFQSKHQELVSGLVERIDPRTGAISLKIGKAEAVLPKNEQIAGENVKEGDYIKVYVVDVRETEKGPKAIISRTHPDLVKRMFETEVPEIYDGTVEIKAVAREAGSRTKLAVMSHNADVDAVGACIGARGSRVSEIVDELGGEKIDIVEYSEDPQKFIAAALSPATVLSVEVAEDGSRACRVTVPDNQLSLAIGNKGQNARLAAKLTGWKIDIKPESGFYGEEA
ncbi:MAG: transcription termination factor NusA [Acutalibacter sp.]|jgi:N utilization substance protein A